MLINTIFFNQQYMNDKEIDAIGLLTKLRNIKIKKNNINKIKKKLINFTTNFESLTPKFIIEYYTNYNITPTPKNIFKILKLHKVLFEMKDNNIIEFIASKTDINSIFGFNTIIVKEINKWTERLTCLGNEIRSFKEGKTLPRVYELMNTLGFFAERSSRSIGTRACSKTLQSTVYIINPDKMINNSYRIGKR